MQIQTEKSQILIQLLIGSGIITREEFDRYKAIANETNVTPIEVILTSGSLEKETLDLLIESLDRIEKKQSSLDFAVRALRIAVQRDISLSEAASLAKQLHRTTTRVFSSVANNLTSLLLEASIVTREQLGPVLVKANQTSMMIGQVMVLNNTITLDMLFEALSAVLTMQKDLVNKQDAARALKYAEENHISFEQALFELQLFKQTDFKDLNMLELFLMSGLISKEQYLECFEIGLFKNKDFAEILEERGLAADKQIEPARQLLSAIKGDMLYAYEAALVLEDVLRRGRSLYASMHEIKNKRPKEAESRLGELLVEASACSKSDIEKLVGLETQSAVKVGKLLLQAGLIDERLLYSGLRLQSSLRLGYISRERVIIILRYCAKAKASLDETMIRTKTYVPSRTQWSWV